MGPQHAWKANDSTGLKEDLTGCEDGIFVRPDIHNATHLIYTAFSAKDCYELYAVVSNHKEQNGSLCIRVWTVFNTLTVVTDKRTLQLNVLHDSLW